MTTLQTIKSLSDTLKFTNEPPSVCLIKFKALRRSSAGADKNVLRCLDDIISIAEGEVFASRGKQLSWLKKDWPAVAERIKKRKEDEASGQAVLL